MTYTADPRVDAYIDALPGWQQAICREVRDLVHAADPEVPRQSSAPPPVLRAAGQHLRPVGAKDHVNIFLYEARSPDPRNHHCRPRQQDRRTRGRPARATSSTRPPLTTMVEQIIANKTGPALAH